MTTLARVFHLMRADFLERTRRYGFLIVMGLTLYAGYQMVPPVDASYIAFSVGGHRPFYSSAWVGTIFGTICGTMLTLIGFFLIRNSVGRDRETRVGRIIASTPTSRLAYVLGKWLSNLAVLAAILAVLTLVAPLMQLLRGEDPQLHLVALVWPLWMIGLPPLALVAALAVLFETAPLLRGAFGSIAFVFLWGFMLISPVGRVFMARETISPMIDVVGLSPSMASLYASAERAGIAVDEGVTDLFEPTEGREVQRFGWNGVTWSLSTVAFRFGWVLVAAVVAGAAAIPFDRFDPARGRSRRRRKQRAKRFMRKRAPPRPSTDEGNAIAIEGAEFAEGEPIAMTRAAARPHLTPLEAGRSRGRLPMLVATELRIMLRGRAWWWWAAGAGLIIAMFVAPGWQRIVPAALWLLPLGIWSAMGSREARSGMTAFVFSTPQPLGRPLLATWLAGVAIGAVVAALTMIAMVATGHSGNVTGLLVGAVFVPSLALALGTWTGSNRAFEVLYVVIWYLGVLGRLVPFDFLGVSPRAIEAGVPLYYVALAVVLVGLAVAGRHRQVQRPA